MTLQPLPLTVGLGGGGVGSVVKTDVMVGPKTARPLSFPCFQEGKQRQTVLRALDLPSSGRVGIKRVSEVSVFASDGRQTCNSFDGAAAV